MADGIVLEKIGLATTVVCTDAFKGSVDAMAAIHGFSNYRYVAVPHPMASRTADELQEMSKEFVDEVATVLGAAANSGREKGQANAR